MVSEGTGYIRRVSARVRDPRIRVYMQWTMAMGVEWYINRAVGSQPILVSIEGEGSQQTWVGCGGGRTLESHRS